MSYTAPSFFIRRSIYHSHIELSHATLKAVGEFLKAKGLEEDAAKITEATMTKVAEAHGFKSDEMLELSEDELESVAGGNGGCFCPVVGGGGGGGLACFCWVVGAGSLTGLAFDDETRCACVAGGSGIYLG